MTFYSPNLKITDEWLQSLKAAFGLLRRQMFAVKDSFTFTDFNPTVDFKGMTATAVNIRRSRYLSLNGLLFFQIDIAATLALPFTFEVQVSLPNGFTANLTNSSDLQAGGASITNAGTLEAGRWVIAGNTNVISLQRSAGGNYAAGAFRCTANGFIEVA